jgi:hypothetical protein
MESEKKGLRYSYRFKLEAKPDGSGSEEQSEDEIQTFINDLLGVKRPKDSKDDLFTV